MKNKINRKRLLILLTMVMLSLGALIFSCSLPGRAGNRLNPADGILDLKDWNPKKDGALSLSGQWDFYWENFLTYQEIDEGSIAPDITAQVPAVWNSYKINGKGLPGFGYGTYVLRVVNAPRQTPLALRIPTFSTAYELYINEELVSSNGKIGTVKEQFEPGYMPQVVEFTPDDESFYLIFHVSNFTYARGGMWYAIPMGTPQQIRRMDKVIADKDLFLFGALSVMAFYYLIIFLLRREDKSSLYYVFMCLLFAARTAIYGDYLIYRLVPFISFRTIINISYITLCWFSVCSAYMVGELFPEENSRKVLRAGFIYAISMTLLFLFTPVSFFTRWVNIVQAMAILFGAYSIYALSKAYVKGKRDAGIVLVGALILIICASHDVLYNNNIIVSNTGELVSFSLFILLLLQSFILSRRFSEAFDNVRTLSMKLLKLDKIKDEFLANTSHELRTPLNGILGITEAMLKGSAGSMSESQKQNLSIIAGSSRRLANLVNDILDYSKMRYGDIKLDIRPIHIESLIYNVVSVFRQLNNTKNYEIFYELPDKLPAVMADENRVLQILYNLVGNAAKYTVSGYIKISAQKSEDMLEICVRDTGEGIPDDKLEDIFLSFEQVDNSITRRHGGTGLGLPITKHLVELQGGSIWVKSRQGEGTEFYLTLPLANTQQEKAVLKEGMPEEYSLKGDIRKGDILKENVLKRDVLKRDVLKGNMLKEDSMKGDILKEDILKRDSLKEDILKYNALIENERNTLLSEMAVSDITVSECGRTLNSMDINEGAVRVLLVDDDSVNLQAASAILKLGGYKVTMAGSGRVALKELEKQTDYSLVILDVMMPEMSGFEVCKKLRERKSAFELPVLMLTAKTSTEDIVMGFESGANDYLPKPFEPEELLARVKTLTNLKRSVEKAKAAEIAFMQAQIKPHFLYNTLNAISSFCDTDPGHAQKLIDNFSNYLRQSFDFKSPEMYVPLEKELSLSSSYAEIEKARFGNKLKVEFDIDSSIKIRVPLLSIQPLIENAITHGIRKKGGGGTVKISVNRIPEGVLVTVEDNGQGMSQEILQTLFMPEAGHGIGLWNINRRLKKLYGKGLSIESEPGKGTRIAFIIPGEAS